MSNAIANNEQSTLCEQSENQRNPGAAMPGDLKSQYRPWPPAMWRYCRRTREVARGSRRRPEIQDHRTYRRAL